MMIVKFLLVLSILIGTSCLSKLVMKRNRSDELEELEDAAIKILTSCNVTETKTIVLAGDFSDNFIKRLSTAKSYALVTMDDRRRSENNIEFLVMIDQKRRHKVDVFVTTAADHIILHQQLTKLRFSLYDNPMAFTLVLAWSSIRKYEGCDGRWQTAEYLFHLNVNNHLKTILLCHERTKGRLMYTSNPFMNKAPQPWQSVPFRQVVCRQNSFYFMRRYQEDENMCENLNFDRTHDMGGSAIQAVYLAADLKAVWKNQTEPRTVSLKSLRIEQKKASTLLDYFIKYVNATKRTLFKQIVVGKVNLHGNNELNFSPVKKRSIPSEPLLYSTYPHTLDENYLITQFRGNKSQLKKIISVINGYSWIGMYLVYAMTLVFFKYFLFQPLIVGTLNLIRLTCNCGLVISPTSEPSRIYMGCLLFFVATMQGIFVGNLAALLIHDFPERQVDSIQNLSDLNNEVAYVDPPDISVFDDSSFEGRVKMLLSYEDCIPYVRLEQNCACLAWGAETKNRASKIGLHVSRSVRMDQLCHLIPYRWALQDRLQRFLGMLAASDIRKRCCSK